MRVNNRWVRVGAIVALLLFTVIGAVAQEGAPTPTGSMLEMLLQAGASPTPAPTSVPDEEAFSLFDAIIDLPRERLPDGGYILGDPDAPITIVEFADWACPHCQTYHDTMTQIIEDYVVTGQARFEFRMFPTAGGRQSAVTAILAECADTFLVDEDEVPYGFWQAHETLYFIAENGRYFSDEVLLILAEQLGLDAEALLECGQAAEAPQVLVDIQLGVDNGVNGTPAVMVRYPDAETGELGELMWIEYDGTLYNRGGAPYEVIAAVIEEANKA